VGLIEPEKVHTIVDPDQYNRTVDSDFVLDVEERLVRRYPAMEWSQRTGGYASLYGITPDWHPVVDEVPAGSGFYVCAGFSGHGFKLGPAIGLMVADMITGESDPEFDPHLFRLSRYDKGELVRSQYKYGIAG
jgi:glycine/D-amino acid oxidase-like deaminating enzyme